MRQVNENELLYNLSYALKALPASVLRDIGAPVREQRERGISAAARALSGQLARYEILSSAPLERAAGNDLFRAAEKMG